MIDESKIANCNSCGAEIVWMKTRNDKNICVDLPDTGDPLRDEVLEAELFDRDRFKTHFETCPNADIHRRPRASSAVPADVDKLDMAALSSVIAKRLNTALAVLEDIAKNPPDGMRSVELAKAGLSQVRAIR